VTEKERFIELTAAVGLGCSACISSQSSRGDVTAKPIGVTTAGLYDNFAVVSIEIKGCARTY
jgi:hypothetical protein